MRFYLETFGCQMNVSDSERVASILAAEGYDRCQAATEADVILLNTCSIREKAANKVYSRLGQLRRQVGSREAIFGVIGCVAQDEADAIFRRAQSVRLVVGPRSISRIGSMLERLNHGYPRAIDVAQDIPSDFSAADVSSRDNRFSAFVSIIEGCNKNCSYCIVPFTRGRENSRSPLAIVEEIDSLIANGFREVCLLGQNVNSYMYIDGKDEISFAKLLKLLAKTFSSLRLKFTTSYPRDFTDDIIQVLVDYPLVSNWVHLPAQSGSSKVLRRMYRQYTREQYLDRVRTLRECGREIALTGDIIVGFCGETEEDFQATLDLLEEAKYDGLYSFAYSPRPHTPAAHFSDTVPLEVKNERLSRLQEHQTRLQAELFERYLGRKLEVLVEGRSADGAQLSGHSLCHKVVNFSGSPEMVGKVVEVKVDKINKNTFSGFAVNVSS